MYYSIICIVCYALQVSDYLLLVCILLHSGIVGDGGVQFLSLAI